MHLLSCFIIVLLAGAATTAEWSRLPVTVPGTQVDAVADVDGVLHIVAKEYLALAADGTVLVRERPDGSDLDGRQGNLDFPPAIAVGHDGAVHTLTRHGGSWGSGHQLQYRRRSANGSWDAAVAVGVPEPRNYTIGIAALDNGSVIAVHGSLLNKSNVWGPLVFWQLAPTAATELGRVDGWWRGDNDCRLRATGNDLRLVVGRNDRNARTRYARSLGGHDIVNDFKDSVATHRGSRGCFPDVALAQDGSSHVVYGDGTDHRLRYRRYNSDFDAIDAEDVTLFTDLGDWHLLGGLGAVAVSPDGQQVLTVALHTNDSKAASICTVEWRLSLDAGATWSPVATIPDVTTHGGEGRRRPRLVWQPGGFTLALFDPSVSNAISLFRLRSGPVEPHGSRTIRIHNPAGLLWDCDPSGTVSFPGAQTQIDDLNAADDHILTPRPAGPG